MKVWEALLVLEGLDANSEVTLLLGSSAEKFKKPTPHVNPANLDMGVYHTKDWADETNTSYRPEH